MTDRWTRQYQTAADKESSKAEVERQNESNTVRQLEQDRSLRPEVRRHEDEKTLQLEPESQVRTETGRLED